MKKALFCAAALLAAAGILWGCQKTPDAPAVIQKDMQQLIEMAQATPSPAPPQAERTPADPADTAQADYIPLPLGQKLQIPAVYIADLTSTNGNVHLTANAEIRIPDTESMPLGRTAKADFRLDELKLLIAGLFGDTTLYWNDGLMTKAEVQASYEHYREHLNVNASRLTSVQRENVKTTIERCAAVLAAMPDDDLFEPWNGALSQETPVSRANAAHPRPNRDGRSAYALTLTDVQKRGASDFARACFDVRGAANGFDPFVNYHVIADARPDSGGNSWGRQDLSVGCFLQNLGPNLSGANLTTACGTMRLTPAEAIAIADKLLAPFPNVTFDGVCYADDHAENTAVEGFGTMDIPATAEAYILSYTQQLLDVKEIYIDGSVTNYDANKEPTFADTWGYPSIQLAVNDDGIAGLLWRAPTQGGAVLVSDATLLPYSEILSVFEKMLFVVHSSRTAGTEIAIDGIQLGLIRIREAGNLDEGLLVPAWAFYGSVASKTDSGISERNEYPEGRPLLLINAVNGSIIDPYKGY